MSEEYKAFPPRVQFTKEEEKIIRANSDQLYNKEEVEKVLKDMGIELTKQEVVKPEENKATPVNVLNDNEPVESFDTDMYLNLDTGVSVDKDTYEYGLTESEKIAYEEEIDKDIVIEGTDDNVETVLKIYKDLTKNDILKIFEIANEYQKSPSKKGLFNKLPNNFKRTIRNAAGTVDKCTLNSCAEFFINDIISEMKVDRAFKELDFENNYKKAYDELMEGLTELEMCAIKADIQKYTVEADAYIQWMKDLIDKANEEDDEEKKKEILKIKDDTSIEKRINQLKKNIKLWSHLTLASKDAIEFTSLKKDIEKNPSNYRKMDKAERLFRDFDYKYTNKEKKTPFACNSIKDVANTLARHLDTTEYSDDDIIKFASAICIFSKNFDACDPIDSQWMMMTCKAVIYLETFKVKDSEYYKILNSIKSIIDLLKEV